MPNAPKWLKGLVAFHVLCIVVWATPEPATPVAQGLREPTPADRIVMWNSATLKQAPPIRTYLLTTGTWQYWDMFAPDPSNTDFYCEAEVVYADGKVVPFRYPRVHNEPIPLKYVTERYRKFFERAHLESSAYMWQAFARRIAFLADDLSNRPVAVRLYRNWLPTAPPGKPQETKYRRYFYFEYWVTPSDLERRAGRILG